MSRTLILKNGFLAVACVAGLTLTACASSSHSSSSSSRYGSVYDYESGGNSCNTNPCAPVAQPYGGQQHVVHGGQQMIGGQAVSPGVVYADCSVVSGMNCNGQQPTQIYTPPAPTAPVYTGGHTITEPVTCPAGTTTNGDGTCMEASTSTYEFPSTTTTTSSHTSYSGEAAPCPTGTTPNGDGSCMQTGSTFGSHTSSSTYTGSTYTGSTYSSGSTVNCPTGTKASGDGTCMETSTTAVTYGNTGHTGYVPSVTQGPTSYLPIRK